MDGNSDFLSCITNMSSPKTQLLDILHLDHDITHVLATTIIGAESGDGKDVSVTKYIKSANSVIQGHDIDIKWDHHQKQSTRFYTAKSIYSDRITHLHGIAIVHGASLSIGSEIRCVVLKSLEVPVLL